MAAASASRLIAREAAAWAFAGATARPHMDQQRRGSAELRHPRGPEAWPAPSGVLRWSGGGVSREPMERWERRARVGSSTAASRSDGVLRAVAAADGARRL